jgi:hypothetical protein
MHFKKALIYLITLVLFSSCKGYVQVVYTKPINANIKKKDGFYTYQNDSVLVAYSFWEDRGEMSFMLFNKMDRPIYVDWKRSAFISENKRASYYTDKTTTNYTAVSNSWTNVFLNNYSLISPLVSANANTIVNGTGTTVKEERITFIPPHSYILKRFYPMLGHIYFDINNRETNDTIINDRRAYVTRPKKLDAISFRNFVTYSFSEDFKDEFYVDNGFYINKIISVKTEDFEGPMHEYPFVKNTCFYITDISKEELEEQEIAADR